MWKRQAGLEAATPGKHNGFASKEVYFFCRVVLDLFFSFTLSLVSTLLRKRFAGMTLL